MRLLYVIILLLGVLGDIITTYIAFTRFGCIVERNPITRSVCYSTDYRSAVIVGGIWEFTVLIIYMLIYQHFAEDSLKEILQLSASLLPYIAVVNNTIFLLTH